MSLMNAVHQLIPALRDKAFRSRSPWRTHPQQSYGSSWLHPAGRGLRWRKNELFFSWSGSHCLGWSITTKWKTSSTPSLSQYPAAWWSPQSSSTCAGGLQAACKVKPLLTLKGGSWSKLCLIIRGTVRVRLSSWVMTGSAVRSVHWVTSHHVLVWSRNQTMMITQGWLGRNNGGALYTHAYKLHMLTENVFSHVLFLFWRTVCDLFLSMLSLFPVTQQNPLKA